MRAIASDFFAESPLMAGPQIAMLIFLAVFVAVVVRVARSRASQWDAAAGLPLSDERAPSREGSSSVAVVDGERSSHE